MNNFEQLELNEKIFAALKRVGFESPTPIQEQVIPLVLKGLDVLGTAQTGTGKTGAFAIPLVSRLYDSDRAALIMAPTRELADQIYRFVEKLLDRNGGLRAVLLVGGESFQLQRKALKNAPRIFVGTPGRINDHLSRRTLDLSSVESIILDEMDRMLDMGFGVQIDEVLRYVPENHQTLMFSATLPPAILRLSSRYLKNPERIQIGSTNAPIAAIKQEVIHTSSAEKYGVLSRELSTREGSILIFVKTREGAESLAKQLRHEDHDASAIHGNLRQNQRDRVLAKFRQQQCRILVATDVAARGLDVPSISHVINYDLPQCPEDYVHRIGRTARAGAEGSALCLLCPSDQRKWQAVNRFLNYGESSDGASSQNFRGQKRTGQRSFREGNFHSGRAEFSVQGRRSPHRDFRSNETGRKWESNFAGGDRAPAPQRSGSGIGEARFSSPYHSAGRKDSPNRFSRESFGNSRRDSRSSGGFSRGKKRDFAFQDNRRSAF